MERLFISQIFLLSLLFFSCKDMTQVPEIAEGYKPLYMSEVEAQEIKVSAPLPIQYPGRIYHYMDHIFINETAKGIHVIDNSDPHDPKPVKFIHISSNGNLSIQNDYLYADKAGNLLVFDISDLDNIQLISTVENVFQFLESPLPNVRNVYFECPDPDKGKIVAWVKTTLDNPQCFK